MEETRAEPFVVAINDDGQRAHRQFWSGPRGSAMLLVPGAVILVVGLVLAISQALAPEGGGQQVGSVYWFFAAVVVFSGAYALYVGVDQRRRTMAERSRTPLAFVLDEEGALFPRNKRYDWEQLRFVVTCEEEPRLLCSPVGLAFRTDRLDCTMAELGTAITDLSAGRNSIELLDG